MSKPLLSVCLIAYNQAQYVQEAIDTILAQKVNFPWELIIADDCSTDGTKEILLEYKQKYPNFIKLILQRSNVGPESNWLDLMAYPKSKYVLYGEGDDYFSDPTKLQRQVDFLESHDNFSICFHPVKVIHEDGSRPHEVFPTPQLRHNKTVLDLSDLLAGNFIQTNSAMYRWRFVEKNIKDVFPRNIAPGDWFLHILHAQVGKIGFINRVMAVYRRHDKSLWWAASNEEFWEKNGLAHLGMYAEVLKLCGDKAELKDAIYIVISQAFLALAGLKDANSEKSVLYRVFLQYPQMSTELFVRLFKDADDTLNLNKLIKGQEEQIQKLKELNNGQEEHIHGLERAMLNITESRAWKKIEQIRRVRAKLRGKI